MHNSWTPLLNWPSGTTWYTWQLIDGVPCLFVSKSESGSDLQKASIIQSRHSVQLTYLHTHTGAELGRKRTHRGVDSIINCFANYLDVVLPLTKKVQANVSSKTCVWRHIRLGKKQGQRNPRSSRKGKSRQWCPPWPGMSPALSNSDMAVRCLARFLLSRSSWRSILSLLYVSSISVWYSFSLFGVFWRSETQNRLFDAAVYFVICLAWLSFGVNRQSKVKY